MSLLTRVFIILFTINARVFAFDASSVQLIHDAISILFPPVRVSLYVCQFDQDEAIEISKMMSAYGLGHEIHGSLDQFVKRSHDNRDHQILYAMDLDCDYTIPLLRVANASGMFMAPIKWLLLRDRISDSDSIKIKETFEDMAIYPDSEVILAERLEVDGSTEIVSIYRPSRFHRPILENRGNWTATDGLRTANFHAASRRRRDLQGTPMATSLVLRDCSLKLLSMIVKYNTGFEAAEDERLRYGKSMTEIVRGDKSTLHLQLTDPDSINHLTDYKDKVLDLVAKATYPNLLYITERMNATLSFRVTNTWGYRSSNGSWNGMIGMLDRREIDIGGTAAYITQERLGVVDYVQLYIRTNPSFIFRKPLLSTVSNIFTLPFERPVWAAVGVLLLIVVILLYLSSKWEYKRGFSEYWKQFNSSELTLSDCFMVVLGAVAQQGYSYEPYRISPRIVTLMLLIAALSLYAAYTAMIVALVRSTTDSIKTPTDLYHSPLKVIVQDVVYNRYYFKHFQDPVRKAIVAHKLDTEGTGPWVSIEEGTRRVRQELVAFHAECSAVYKMMQETYQEEEKCGIMEMDFLNIVYPLLVIQARSPYSEMIRNTALLLRESGLKYRAEYRLFTAKPKCEGQMSYISIGFTESYFALMSMGCGTLISVVVFLGEFLWYKKIEPMLVSDPIVSFRDKIMRETWTDEDKVRNDKIDDDLADSKGLDSTNIG